METGITDQVGLMEARPGNYFWKSADAGWEVSTRGVWAMLLAGEGAGGRTAGGKLTPRSYFP